MAHNDLRAASCDAVFIHFRGHGFNRSVSNCKVPGYFTANFDQIKQIGLTWRLSASSTPMHLPRITFIVAMDRKRGIGINNQLPWRLPEDLAHFKRTTTGHPIIMGRKTHESIGRPLPNRRNIVVTRNPDWQAAGVETAASPEAACALIPEGEQAFIIGGAELFVQTFPLADCLIVTEIDAEYPCDTFFPEIDSDHWKVTGRQAYHSAASGLAYAIVTYMRTR
ncbi:dihydrofolate reductase [Noviherbaspirillum soli]|uniref:dihydrofolate reductase n=1 Tax=Noviherbaspirillum soli TaxID=1064518 RepID=UPI003898F281